MNVQVSGKIRAAVADVEITDLVSLEHRGRHHGPARRAGALRGRALLLAGGEDELLLVVLDLLELYQPWMERFQAALQRFTGVPAERQVIWCNHIHAAGNSDGVAEVPLADRLSWAIEKARADYASAEIALGRIDLGPGWTIRRRFALDGLETFCVMFNDGCRVEGEKLEVSEQVRTYLQSRRVDPACWPGLGRKAYCVAPADTRLEVLCVRRRTDRRPIATLVRFACHPVIASASRIGNALHPDLIGGFREAFERDFGGKVLFVQGPSGDVRPLHEQYGTEAAEAYGKRLAAAARPAMRRLRFEPLSRAALAKAVAPLRLRGEYRWSEKRLAQQRERLAGQIEAEKDPARKLKYSRRAEVLRWVDFFRHARPTILPAAWLRKGIFLAEVSAVRLGDVLLVGLPSEAFCQTGLRLLEDLRREAIRTETIVTELAGPYVSYVPGADEYGTGGYEDTSCFFTESAESALRAAAVEAAGSLFP